MATNRNDDIDAQIRDISIQLDKLTRSMHIEVGKNKTLKRKASRNLLTDLEFSAPLGKTGNLASSMQYLPFKGLDVFLGPSYKFAPHAHLVEYGFVHYKDGEKKDKWSGIGFIRKAYERNKAEILQNLIWLAAKEFEDIGRELEVRE